MAATAIEWEPSMLEAEIEALRKRYEEQADSDQPSPRLQYEYACLLICSPKRAEIREGARLLDQLLEVGFNRPEVLHQLTLTYLKLGQYVRAKEHVDMWLCLQPRNGMARFLHSLVLDRASHDGLIGLFTLGFLGLGMALALLRSWR
uniref:Mitochondrial fission 1 protein n=1 Tax=Pyrodinium bahamense TaxID=73915 RepID=A0A7S0FY40_9DINO|mmetsp:Transcript_7288/g.20171  ORF Transcript_7288/g.20171 Transcript_7288/m.20171 type:complete len:147 (+) Transcript_7288:125-565(+)